MIDREINRESRFLISSRDAAGAEFHLSQSFHLYYDARCLTTSFTSDVKSETETSFLTYYFALQLMAMSISQSYWIIFIISLCFFHFHLRRFANNLFLLVLHTKSSDFNAYGSYNITLTYISNLTRRNGSCKCCCFCLYFCKWGKLCQTKSKPVFHFFCLSNESE
jgi:hypothetical protein